ncbi:MAG: ATP-binding protein [Azoarcus sp.]|nr:MAG: ATP-binding protein [Azoarcus sp.]TVT53234.1 MAG: ATP-binding protein [Azoarcus sp. PHD]
MNAPMAPDWVSANQQLLVHEFARLRALLQPEATAVPSTRARSTEHVQALHEHGAIDQLTGCFDLSGFERDLLLLCAGVEMDAGVALACAHGHGDEGRPWASFGLALAALQAPHWSALSPHSPLRHWRLIEIDPTPGLATARLRIDERILHFLAGINELDRRLSPLVSTVDTVHLQPPSHGLVTRQVIDTLTDAASNRRTPPLILFEGDDPMAQRDIAARAASALGLGCRVLNTEDIPRAADERSALQTLWAREARLLGVALIMSFTTDSPDETAAARGFLEHVGGTCFACGNSGLATVRPARRFRVDKPAGGERHALWTDALDAETVEQHSAELERTASHFRLSSHALQAIALEASNASRTNRAQVPATGSGLWQRCRQETNSALDALAQRLSTEAGWDDLVLPDAQLGVLRQIAAHVRQRHVVFERWGFAGTGSRGLGLASLFAGESGTGKTLAAEVLANALQLDLYRVDLSSVVSKYIGETEKNLRRIFDAAEDCGAILLFDEADALFGKRSEVKDSHDRYANIEVSYLLQRMESYHGLAILTTNLKSSLDSAFTRRLRFVVQFPFPDSAQRLALWKRAFPPAAPTATLDFDKLARLSVTGGSIRNIALSAAFLAADAGDAIGMQHLLQAAHGDAAKREHPLTDAETRGWT